MWTWKSALAMGIMMIVVGLILLSYLEMVSFNKRQLANPATARQTVDDQLFSHEEMDYILHGDSPVPLIDRNDPRYLQFLRSHLTKSSNSRKTPVNVGQGGAMPDMVSKLVGDKQHGFFVECGANDGTFQSNTLFLESTRNWTGLLVEANPRLVRKLLAANRRAYVYGGCLSPEDRPTSLKFTSAGCCGGLADHITGSLQALVKAESVDTIQCFPLTHLLSAIGVNHVDYLSLDVHGAEIPILKTINFHEFRIDALTVECYEPNNATKLQHMINELSSLFAATGLYYPVKFLPPFDVVVQRIDTSKKL